MDFINWLARDHGYSLNVICDLYKKLQTDWTLYTKINAASKPDLILLWKANRVRLKLPNLPMLPSKMKKDDLKNLLVTGLKFLSLKPLTQKNGAPDYTLELTRRIAKLNNYSEHQLISLKTQFECSTFTNNKRPVNISRKIIPIVYFSNPNFNSDIIIALSNNNNNNNNNNNANTVNTITQMSPHCNNKLTCIVVNNIRYIFCTIRYCILSRLCHTELCCDDLRSLHALNIKTNCPPTLIQSQTCCLECICNEN